MLHGERCDVRVVSEIARCSTGADLTFEMAGVSRAFSEKGQRRRREERGKIVQHQLEQLGCVLDAIHAVAGGHDEDGVIARRASENEVDLMRLMAS